MTQTAFFSQTPDSALLDELSRADTGGPFMTGAYFDARRRTGSVAFVIGVRGATGSIECACGAFLRRGRVNSGLEIVSLPQIAGDSPFWTGLQAFCSWLHVTELGLFSFGSPEGVHIPSWADEQFRRERCEFWLDLGADLLVTMDPKHKRELKRAAAAGVSLRRTRDTATVASHLTVVEASMSRRRARGEQVFDSDSAAEHHALLDTGAGELFQTVLGDEVLSSAMVLQSPRVAYLLTTGTTQKGMSLGASHFLIHSVASLLKEDGVGSFGLGGAEKGSGLARFKHRFGARQVYVPEVRAYVGPRWKAWVSALIASAQEARSWVSRQRSQRHSSLVVYAIDPATLPVAPARDDLEFRRLSAIELAELPATPDDFKRAQLERLQRFGESYAYAVFCGGKVAHISWLLPREAMERDQPRWLKPRVTDAEITCCETLPDSRGKGIYPFAIRKLADVARDNGVRRVFMKTTPDNVASRAGILRAGLKPAGRVDFVRVPLLGRELVWRRLQR